MQERLTGFVEERLRLPKEQAGIILQRLLIGLAALFFVLSATLIVAFDSIFVGFNNIATLQVGSIAPRDIVAPPDPDPFVSDILTEQARAEARNNVQPIFAPPDPSVSRQQTQLAQQILDFITNIRADRYATLDQRVNDVNAITALRLERDIIEALLQIDSETWDSIEDEVINVLSRVMQQEIRPDQLQRVRTQLSVRVSTRFSARESDIIVAIVEDLIQANTFENVEATEEARREAAAAVAAQTKQFVTGQIIVRGGEPITPEIYETLQALNLLRSQDVRTQVIGRSLIASTIILVVAGLYMVRFNADLFYNEQRLLALIAGIFLVVLAGTRLLGVGGNIYLFPAAALSLLYVAIAGPHVAVIGSLGLALLTGMMANDSLQITVLVAAGGIMGALSLRRAERLNSFFVAGAMIGAVDAAVVGIFNMATPTAVIGNVNFASQLLLTFSSGLLLVPATSIAAMYLVTMGFNLPTALKLIDLSQPNKPLLQRLLREAPGTYQHSLQVANLAEQAANAIGGDAQLTHVAALYHDIGKMLNPLYFTENQQDIGNPHDTLNDPYRSADIIIGHVTEGDELARQYRLPRRIREFIQEHHGTTQVYVFYRRAINQVDGDESAVDISDFSYPGPRPRSKETAILMMADSCEAAVRSVKPQSKQEINDLIGKIIDDKRRSGQLDDSGLTLNDIRTIQAVFVSILQSMFHPRINYREAVSGKPEAPRTPKATPAARPKEEPVKPPRSTDKQTAVKPLPPAARAASVDAPPREEEAVEEEPLTEVPRLPSMDERRITGTHGAVNGLSSEEEQEEES